MNQSLEEFKAKMETDQIERTGKEYYFYKEFQEIYPADIELFTSPQDVHNAISRIFWLDEDTMQAEYINVLEDIDNDNRDGLGGSDTQISVCYYNILNLIASIQLLVEERDLLKKKLGKQQ